MPMSPISGNALNQFVLLHDVDDDACDEMRDAIDAPSLCDIDGRAVVAWREFKERFCANCDARAPRRTYDVVSGTLSAQHGRGVIRAASATAGPVRTGANLGHPIGRL